MQLSSKLVKNLESVNSWAYTDSWTIGRDGSSGEAATFAFQIVDLDREGIRYVPSAQATLEIIFPSLNNETVLTKVASFPYADDRSLWTVSLLSTDLPQSGVVRFSLTDGGVTRRWSVTQALRVNKVNGGSC